MIDDVETSFGGDFLSLFRDQGHLIRSHATGDFDDLFGRSQFQVQLDIDRPPQDFQIAILNMPPIFTQVNCDTIRTAEFGQRCCPNWVRSYVRRACRRVAT